MRREDILPLAEHFLELHRGGGGLKLALGKEAADLLAAHSWPGNVRQLENAIERAAVLARTETIGPEDLLLERPMSPSGSADGGHTAGGGTLQECLDRAAELRIRAALEVAGDQRLEAARALGMGRTTLYGWMKRLNIA